MFFWNSLVFSMIQQMLAIWSLVPLPFLKPAWTSEVHGSCTIEAWLGEFWALCRSQEMWKILKEMGIPDHLTCVLRNLYAGQKATVRTRRGTTYWLKIGKGVCQGCILSPCLFNLYVEYIMRNAGLEEAQAGINIARRNINNLKYADDTTLM